MCDKLTEFELESTKQIEAALREAQDSARRGKEEERARAAHEFQEAIAKLSQKEADTRKEKE